MNSENPYAAPSYEPIPVATAIEVDQIWRDGKFLVMTKNAELPDRCVKSNEPATRRLKRKLTWHHPALYVLIFGNLLIYAIVAVIISKKATIEIPMTDDWFRRRRRRITIAWLLVLTSIGLFVACAASPNDQTTAILIVSGICLFLFAALYGAIGARMIYAKRITDHFVWVGGISSDYLLGFPDLPPGIR